MDHPLELETLFQKVTAEARQISAASIAKLQRIATELGPERLFTAMFVMLALSSQQRDNLPVKVELIAYHLYPLFGQAPRRPITPDVLEEAFAAAETLRTSYVQALTFQQQTEGATASPDVKALVKHLILDTRIVRGSAYPEQTMQEVSEVQGHFEEWFRSHAGIGLRRAIELLMAVGNREDEVAHEWRVKLREGALDKERAWKAARKALHADRTAEQRALLSAAHTPKQAQALGYAQVLAALPPDDIPVAREGIDLSPPPTKDEWQALIKLIGCTVELRQAMQDPVEMQRRPLFVLSERRLLLCDISNALDQLWTAFDDMARQDQAFYSSAYQRYRGQWLEARITALLERIFPPGAVYRSVTYPDPDRGQGARAELDVAIHWPPFLVLVEGKAAQFRFQSQFGDIGRLRTDLKANVADAFEQARRASRFIRSVPEAAFVEGSTGRTLVVRRDDLQRMYLTTVSLHHLAGIATRLASVRGLELFGDSEYPWALSVADLDLVTQFCPGPDVFLHYVERRLAIQREMVAIHGDELDHFGAYLGTRLQASRIWDRGGKRPDWVWLAGFQEPFDAVMAHRRGERPDAPQISLQIPLEVERVLGELRGRQDDEDARWIAFSLLSLSDRALEIVARMFRDLKSQSLKADAFRRITVAEGDLAISVVATKDQPRDSLLRNTQTRTLFEKYRRKCSRSIGFGVMVSDSSKPFECAVWVDWPWKYDPEMEKLIETEPAPIPAPGSKLPGVNQPCICGSGKKFKKCCLPKMQRSRGT